MDAVELTFQHWPRASANKEGQLASLATGTVRSAVSAHRRVLTRLLSGTGDQNIRFAELCGLLRALGFKERVRGSHAIFSREDVAEILNLQPRDGGHAKPYQVRQVRDIIVRCKLAGEGDGE